VPVPVPEYVMKELSYSGVSGFKEQKKSHFKGNHSPVIVIVMRHVDKRVCIPESHPRSAACSGG
jgi:hypothetical protein